MTREEYIKESYNMENAINNLNNAKIEEMQKYEDRLDPHTRARLSLFRIVQMSIPANPYGVWQMCEDYQRVCDVLDLTKEYLEIQADIINERIRKEEQSK